MSTFAAEFAAWNKSKNTRVGAPVLPRVLSCTSVGAVGGASLFAPWDEEEIRKHEKEPLLASLPFHKPAFIIRQLLSSDECKALIAAIPFCGDGYMSPAEMPMFYRDRVVHRYMTIDETFSSLVEQRLRPFLPKALPLLMPQQPPKEEDEANSTTKKKWMALEGVSPEWRFLHYELGGYQGRHIDGREARRVRSSGSGNDNSKLVESRLTLQMYLNDHDEEFKGGELCFFAPNDPNGEPCYTYEPRAGDCLLFFQEDIEGCSAEGEGFHLLHEARSVTQGHKYSCRTMIDYSYCEQSEDEASSVEESEEGKALASSTSTGV